MVKFTKYEKKQLQLIASFYGCKLKFDNDMIGGRWHGSYIVIGTKNKTLKKLVSVFFHELGHFINWKTGKYPIYHNTKEWFGDSFKSYPKQVRYALNAEICTEKQGEKLLKQWFPSIKYIGYYKNNKVCYEFLYGYYLR